LLFSKNHQIIHRDMFIYMRDGVWVNGVFSNFALYALV
jgi:hypothetical protein